MYVSGRGLDNDVEQAKSDDSDVKSLTKGTIVNQRRRDGSAKLVIFQVQDGQAWHASKDVPVQLSR